jgi:ParB-like chromosome segregation protein Spo0J
LKLAEVPLIVLDHLTDAQKRAYIIADNKLALNAGWDEDLLKIELASLRDDGFVLDLLGFSDDEIDDFLSETATGAVD